MRADRSSVGRLIDGVRAVNRVGHYLAGAVLLAMLGLTVFDILGRWLFDSPVSGTVEVTPLLLVTVVYLGLAHAQHEGDHISVDLVYNYLPPSGQRIAARFSNLFTLIVLAIVTWQLWVYAGVQASAGYTTAVLEWRISWFVRIAAAGAALLWIATLTEIVDDLIADDPLDEECTQAATADEDEYREQRR